jgi:hypothetical protein
MELLAIFRRTKIGDAALKERTVPLSITQRFFLTQVDGKKNLGEIQQLSPRHFADMVGLVQGLSRLQLIELVVMPSTQRNSSTQTGTKTGGVTSTGVTRTQGLNNTQALGNTQGVTKTNNGYVTNAGQPTHPEVKTTQSGSATNPGVTSTNPNVRSTNPGVKITESETLSGAKDAVSRLVQQYYGPMANHTVTKVQKCSSLLELSLLIQQTSQTMVEAFSRLKAEAFYREAMALLPNDGTV